MRHVMPRRAHHKFPIATQIAIAETPRPSRLPPFPKISKLVQSANLCRS
jgi:hypothetical protein